MKGTLEICFPSIAPNLPVISSWLEHAPSLRSATQAARNGKRSGTMQREFRNSYFKKRAAFYCELIRKEWILKNQGPFWQSFNPSRLSLRLSTEWFEYASMASSLGDNILRQAVRTEFDSDSSSVEVVISASDVSAMARQHALSKVPVIVLSDLDSLNPGEDWKKTEGYNSLLQRHASFGIELQASTWEHRNHSFRKQLQAVSELQPAFIRITQRRVKDDDSLFGCTRNVPARMRTLQLGLESFQLLDYEPVCFQSHQITLLPSSKAAGYQSEYGTNHCVLALGAGGVSLRYDAQGRVITKRNPEPYARYRGFTQNQWKRREGVTTGEYLPYIHQAIEKDFGSDGKISYSSIENRFGVNLEQVHPGLSRVLENAGLVQCDGDEVSLTDEGKQLHADVARNFFITEQDLLYIQ